MRKFNSENLLKKDYKCDQDNSRSTSTYEGKICRDGSTKLKNDEDRLSRWENFQDLTAAGTAEVGREFIKLSDGKLNMENIKDEEDDLKVLSLTNLKKNLMLDENLQNILLRRLNFFPIGSPSRTSETKSVETILRFTPEPSSMVQHFTANRRFIKNKTKKQLITPETETHDPNEIIEKNNTEEISPTILEVNKNNAFQSNVKNVSKNIPEAEITLIKSKWNKEDETYTLPLPYAKATFLSSNENTSEESFNENKKFLNSIRLIPICHGFISESSMDSPDNSLINSTHEISPINVDNTQSTPAWTNLTKQILDPTPEASTSRHQKSSVKEQTMDVNQGGSDAKQSPSKFITKTSTPNLKQNTSEEDSSESIILLSSDLTQMSSEVTHQSSGYNHQTSAVTRNLDSIVPAGNLTENLTESTRNSAFTGTYNSIIQFEDTDLVQLETRGERVVNTLVFTICLIIVLLLLGAFWASAFLKTEIFE